MAICWENMAIEIVPKVRSVLDWNLVCILPVLRALCTYQSRWRHFVQGRQLLYNENKCVPGAPAKSIRQNLAKFLVQVSFEPVSLHVLIKWWPWPWLRSHGNLLGKHGDWNSSKSSLCIGLKLGRYITGITCSMYIPVSMTSISFRGDNYFIIKILGFSLAPSSLLNPFHRFARKFRQLLRQIWCSFRTIEKVTLNSA